MTNQLSPAAQAVLDVFWEGLHCGDDWKREFENRVAAALRSLASTWETEISGQPRTEFISGIRNCITSLQEIAEDLEGQS